MPNTSELDSRLRSVELQVAEARGGRTAWLTILSIAVALMIAVISWALTALVEQGKQITAMNTLLTQQLPKIALSHTGESNQTEAANNYKLAKSALSMHQKPGGANNEQTRSNADRLALVLSKQADAHDNLPEYWQLASTLIDERGKLGQQGELSNCLDHDPRRTQGEESVGFPFISDQHETYRMVMLHCKLQLDQPDFWNTWLGKSIKKDQSTHPKGVSVSIELREGVVSYAGGPIIPVNFITSFNCRFQMNFPDVPSPVIKQLGKKLLTADLSNVAFPLRAEVNGS